MASLTLGFVKQNLGYGSTGYRQLSIGAGLVARVTQWLDADGKQAERPETRELVIPVGLEDTQVDGLPAGLYAIEVALPSGELLTRQADLRHQPHETISFDDDHSPYEWLSWQHLEGAVPSGREYHSPGRALPLTKSPRGVVPVPSPGPLFRPVAGGIGFDAIDVAPAGTVPMDRLSQVSLYRRPIKPESGRPSLNWKWLIDSLEGRSPDWAGSGSLSPVREVEPKKFGYDQLLDSWRMHGFRTDHLYFALVETPDSTELARLPIPWPGADGGSDFIEITVDKSPVHRPFRANVSLLDPNLFGLLSYFKRRSFALGRTVIEKGLGGGGIIDMLQAKMENPIAAAGAALCLLAASDLTRDEQWHPWIRNLDQWFEWLPDGAVAHARLMAGRGDGEPGEIRAAYLRAFDRGLPFYMLGLSWLLEGLSRFDDEECRHHAGTLRRAAVRADVSQAFTVLRMGDLRQGL